jgi:hypothetical protein
MATMTVYKICEMNLSSEGYTESARMLELNKRVRIMANVKKLRFCYFFFF